MSILVQKFGGTSVGTIERIKAVAGKIIKTYEAGNQVVVVVSAMSGDTDRLIDMANALSTQPDAREFSVLVSTGEQISMALLAMYLLEQGYPAKSYTGMQAGIVTDAVFRKARIQAVNCDAIKADLAENKIVIVAGFQGVDNDGNITTLGRGGSDTSAVALAASLNAKECQIYTDVAGVFTADPRIVPEARCLSHVTFEEMLELASLGAKVLQKRSVEFAGKHQVVMRVLSSFEDEPGTLITFEEANMEQPLVSGIAYNRSEAKITIMGVPDAPGTQAAILVPIAENNIDIDMIIQNIGVDGTTDFTFTVNREEYLQALELMQTLCKKLGADRVTGDTRIAKISLVGVGMRSHTGIASRMFHILGSEGISIQLISTSEIKVSVVVDEKYLELGVRALHAGFGLEKVAKEEYDPAPLVVAKEQQSA